MTRPQNPPVTTWGLREKIRAARVYLGLSKDGMAAQLSMSDRTYDRIENGTAPCPAGLLDTITVLLDQFDLEVDAVIQAAKNRQREEDTDAMIEVAVDDAKELEWERNVVARAAVESDIVLPVLA